MHYSKFIRTILFFRDLFFALHASHTHIQYDTRNVRYTSAQLRHTRVKWRFTDLESMVGNSKISVGKISCKWILILGQYSVWYVSSSKSHFMIWTVKEMSSHDNPPKILFRDIFNRTMLYQVANYRHHSPHIFTIICLFAVSWSISI